MLNDAKRRAAEEDRTLGELVTEALRERLARRSSSKRKPYRTVTFGEGGSLPGVDLNDNARTREIMDAD